MLFPQSRQNTPGVREPTSSIAVSQVIFQSTTTNADHRTEEGARWKAPNGWPESPQHSFEDVNMLKGGNSHHTLKNPKLCPDLHCQTGSKHTDRRPAVKRPQPESCWRSPSDSEEYCYLLKGRCFCFSKRSAERQVETLTGSEILRHGDHDLSQQQNAMF